MEHVQEALLWLQSLKTVCETAGVDPSLLQWAVTVIVGVSITIGTLHKTYKVTRAVCRWFAPKDEIADKIVKALEDEDVEFDQSFHRLNSGNLSVKVLLDGYENVKEVEGVSVGPSVLHGYAVLPKRSKRRISDAAHDAMVRCRQKMQARKRKELLAALKAI